MSENEASPYTGASEPSDEAIARWSDKFGGGMIPFDDAYSAALSWGATPAWAQTAGVRAVLAAELPRIVAEAHAAGARERTEEIVAWLRLPATSWHDNGPPRTEGYEYADAIVARFSEQEQPG